MKRDLDALTSRSFDLLVVGGGIVGAAAAWDAAQRGLAVALVESGDFGSGTSWNSLKTIHGGLRQLQRFDLSGLRESVRERRALMKIAPSLMRPLGFVVPGRGHGLRGREAFAVAAALYSLLSADRNQGVPDTLRLKPARLLSAAELRGRAGGALAGEVSGGLFWEDVQVQRPERLLLSFVEAATRHGAVATNYVEVEALRREGGKVTGADLRDVESGRALTVRAGAVLAAVGSRLDTLLEASGLPPTRRPWLLAVNVVLAPAPPAELAVAGESSGRNLFLVPWRGRTMLGTDYAPVTADVEGRVAALLSDGAAAFPAVSLRREDVTLVHRGFVPGAHGGALGGDEIREHAPGLLSAVAGKYTTARALAERAVDRVERALGRPHVAGRTSEVPLPVASDEGLALEDRVRRAVREEMARRLEDVVRRRTDLGTAGRPPEDVLDAVARVMAAERGGDAAAAAAERQALVRGYP
jgi:glycerol-3-phosphate dehydrogenase